LGGVLTSVLGGLKTPLDYVTNVVGESFIYIVDVATPTATAASGVSIWNNTAVAAAERRRWSLLSREPEGARRGVWQVPAARSSAPPAAPPRQPQFPRRVICQHGHEHLQRALAYALSYSCNV